MAGVLGSDSYTIAPWWRPRIRPRAVWTNRVRRGVHQPYKETQAAAARRQQRRFVAQVPPLTRAVYRVLSWQPD